MDNQNEPKDAREKSEETIHKLIEMAGRNISAGESLHYSQAALNAANALCALKNFHQP